ncbi:MAG: GNAT family protein [Burkholderiaceae bacterium]
MNEFPSLTTERLSLREVVIDDAATLFAIHGDPVVMRWFGVEPLTDLAGAHKLVELFAGMRTQANPGTRWGITRQADGELLGTCGLFGWNRNWRKCALGYELSQAAWGQGFMREALVRVIDWGFEHMELNRIEAQVHPANTASLKLLAALGFVQEGVLREVGHWGGSYHDMVQLSLLKREHTTKAAPA